MKDLIDRQAAIDAIEHRLAEPAYQHTGEDWYVGMNCAESELYELPSAEPERKKGKWIYGEDEYGIDGYHCDKCGFFVPWDYAHTFINYIEDYNFCPNCGADMRGEQDE